jgi:hypothetical protein
MPAASLPSSSRTAAKISSPVMNIVGGEVEGGDLVTELNHNCPIGLVEHRIGPNAVIGA